MSYRSSRLLVWLCGIAGGFVTILTTVFVAPDTSLFYVAFYVLAAWTSLRFTSLVLQPSERLNVEVPVIAGLALRAFFAIAAYSYLSEVTGSAFLLKDDELYHDSAVEAVSLWSHQGIRGTWHVFTQSVGGAYTAANGLLYLVVGPDTLAARLINVWLGTLAIPLVYRLARRIGGAALASQAAMLYAVFPVAVFWSAFQFKDTLSGVLLLGALEAWLSLKDSRAVQRWIAAAVLLTSLVVMSTVRFENLLVLAVTAAGVSLLFSSPRYTLFVIATGVLLGCAVFLGGGIAVGDVQEATLAAVQRRRDVVLDLVANTQQPGLSTALYSGEGSFFTEALRFTARVAFMLVAPLPGFESAFATLISPAMVFWYLLLPWWGLGVFALAHRPSRAGFHVLGLEFLSLCALALTLLMTGRHTAQLLPLHAIVAVCGWRIVRACAWRAAITTGWVMALAGLAILYPLIKNSP